MEKEFRKIIEGAKRIKLSSEEKLKMRDNLRLFIESNPAGEGVESGFSSPFRSIFNINPLRLRTMPAFAAVTALVLVISGGTSLAAEFSLPGDVLYKLKVDVNEKARAIIAVSDVAEAKLAARLAERRLQEAAQLAAEGRLSPETEAQIGMRFNAHVEKFEKQVNKLTTEGKAKSAVQLSSSFEASLKVQGQVIAGAKRERESDNPLLTTVDAKLTKIQKNRADIETKISADAKADVEAASAGRLRAASNKVAEVRGLIERTKGSVAAEVTLDAEARLRLAEEAVAEGKASLETEEFVRAFASFDQAHRLAQEAQVIINGGEGFKIDVAPPVKLNGGGESEGKASVTSTDSIFGETKTETGGEGKFWFLFGR